MFLPNPDKGKIVSTQSRRVLIIGVNGGISRRLPISTEKNIANANNIGMMTIPIYGRLSKKQLLSRLA
jgi:hypothetical protein